jgi:hypothetical protein
VSVAIVVILVAVSAVILAAVSAVILAVATTGAVILVEAIAEAAIVVHVHNREIDPHVHKVETVAHALRGIDPREIGPSVHLVHLETVLKVIALREIVHLETGLKAIDPHVHKVETVAHALREIGLSVHLVSHALSRHLSVRALQRQQ